MFGCVNNFVYSLSYYYAGEVIKAILKQLIYVLKRSVALATLRL